MSRQDQTMLPPPLPGRECGGCTVCCVALEIDDPALKKADGVRCLHMQADGCGIHASLPRTCRNWYCGWRLLNLGDAMRPDRSGILLVPELGTAPGYEKGGLRIVLVDGNDAALANEELLTLAARCVAGGVPIFLSSGDGAMAGRVLINNATKGALAAGDKAAFLAVLRKMMEAMAMHMGHG